jgi:hypothetical protein
MTSVSQVGFRGVIFNVDASQVTNSDLSRKLYDLDNAALKDFADRKIGVREKVANTDRCYRLVGELTVAGVLTRA